MASKKLKKALMAGLAGAAIAGMGRASNTAFKENNIDKGRGSSIDKMYRSKSSKTVKQDLPMKKPTEETKKGFLKSEVFTTTPKTTVKDAVAKVKDTAKKVMSMGPGKNATPKKGGTLAGDYGNAFSDEFGMPQGAKYGKMIKAKNGIMARGCKLGRNKRTIIT